MKASDGTRILQACEITGDDYVYVSDSQDLESLHHNLPVCPDGMTGALVRVEDGDYAEVWVTEWSRPYASSAVYERIV